MREEKTTPGSIAIKWNCEKNGPFKDGMGGVDWIGLIQDRDRSLAKAVMNLQVP
jgi:hypothetical protein